MKHKHLIPIICLFGLILTLCTLSSCGESAEPPLYDHLVTFDYNVGDLTLDCKEQYLGVKDGGKIGLVPGDHDEFKQASTPHYTVEGWYTPKLAEDGTPMTDPATGRVLLDKKWSFATDTVSGDMTLYANLVRQSFLIFADAETGETLKTISSDPGSTERDPLPPSKKGYTLLGYYADREKTTPFTFPYTYTENDVTVYADFLEGTWSLVDTAAELQKALRSSKNIYLTADIDMTGVEWATLQYNGTLEGNGHKISGISFARSGDRKNRSGFGLFTTLGAKTKLSHVTFENVSITFTANLNDTYRVAPVADEVKAGARLDGVTVTGTLRYDISKAMTSEILPDFVKNGAAADAITGCQFAVTLVDQNEE